MTYFNSIKVACPTWKYLQWYDTNYTKICATAPIGPKWDTWATGAKWDTWARWANGTNGTNGTNATFDASNTLDLYYCPCNNMGRTSGSEQLEYANMINMWVVSQFSNTLWPSWLSIVSTCAYYNGNIGDAWTMQELNCTKIWKILK